MNAGIPIEGITEYLYDNSYEDPDIITERAQTICRMVTDFATAARAEAAGVEGAVEAARAKWCNLV